ncbi:LPS-assembly protein LptD [Pedobacter polaris]|uniref:LPS-assembly protein LptD n=1 Tax=Pedobacter polaris TaxID=2571273 RepID=A0A4U1CRJ0_9SPHI|nr:putative LPS assembly protein LptD [Pedobacter polaris]TKC10314.1 LPS-assembly protein LptD [Pedobacter polaris]
MKLLRYIIFFICALLLTSVGNKAFALSNFSFQQITKQTDSSKKDTAKVGKKMTKGGGGLDDKLEYYAKDTTAIDRKNGVMQLYGSARVIYEDFELDAEYIRFDSRNNTIFARGVKNDKGKYFGRPIFKMGKDGTSIADSLTYNTKMSKGIVYGVSTEQEGGFFSGGIAKIQPDEEIHSLGQTFSTCNLPEPHFGIHFTKAIITKNQIITGPLYMEFERIPMPLGLPFAFFPKPNKKSSGFILPTPGEDATKGFSLTNGGYYIALNDYWDAKLTGNIFTNGSYDLSLATNYIKRYKFTGNFNLAYSSTRNGLEGTPEYTPQKNFHIGWTHSQNPNARPGTTFSASVNAGTSTYFRTTGAMATNDFNQIAQNTLSSSIAYGKVFGNGLFNLTSALTHSQETSTKTITLTLPTVSLNMSTINPFDSKDRVGPQKFYQKLTVGYSLEAKNFVSDKESLVFKKGGLSRFQNGIQHNVPISLPFNVLQFLNFNTSVNYSEKWYFQTIEKRFIRLPTSDSTRIDTVSGFKRAGEYSLNMGMSTKLYGKKEFKKPIGNISAIRHVITPNIGFSYKPDFSSSNYGYYKEQVYYTNDIRPGKSVPIANDGSEIIRGSDGKPLKYSIFEQAAFGGPSAGKYAGLNFSIDNNVELKVLSTKDTTGTGEKKIPIIQGLSFASSYNFVAKEKKLAPISFSGRSQFTDKLGFNFGGVFSPYAVDNIATTYGAGTTQVTTYSYQEVDRYVWKDGKLPRLTSFNFSTDFSFNPDALKKRNENMDAVKGATDKANNGNKTQEQIEQLAMISRDPNAFVDFNIPWNIALGYSFNYSNPLGRKESRTVSNSLSINGDFNLTPKWKIQFTSGFDFKRTEISPTSFTIYRDLHCWDLSATWVPFGLYQSYSIDIKVKASILQDLKLSKRKGYYTKY